MDVVVGGELISFEKTKYPGDRYHFGIWVSHILPESKGLEGMFGVLNIWFESKSLLSLKPVDVKRGKRNGIPIAVVSSPEFFCVDGGAKTLSVREVLKLECVDGAPFEDYRVVTVHRPLSTICFSQQYAPRLKELVPYFKQQP